MAAEDPDGIVRQADRRLTAHFLPLTARPKSTVLQQAEKLLSILGVRSGTALEQLFHLAVAKQRLTARMAKQQSGVQFVYGLLHRVYGDLGAHLLSPQQADVDASHQTEQDTHHK